MSGVLNPYIKDCFNACYPYTKDCFNTCELFGFSLCILLSLQSIQQLRRRVVTV